ncbi:MAG: class I SAM-dependent methyltransferase [Thermodesulfobacteriota bacterium]
MSLWNLLRNPEARNMNPSRENNRFWTKQVAACRDAGTRKQFPNEHFVRFMRKEVGPIAGKNVLDFGFFTGAELLFLASEGAQCHGLDVSIEAVEYADSILREAGYKADLQVAAGHWPDLGRNRFHLVYALESAHYLGSWESLANFIDYAHGLLVPGGHFLCSMPTQRHFFHNVSDDLGENIRAFNASYPLRQGVSFLLLKDEPHVRNVFFRFPKISVGYYEYCMKPEEISSFWFISCRKED